MTVKRVLLATDGSDPSLRATEYVQSLTGTLGVEVTLLHVRQEGALNPAVMAAAGEGIALPLDLVDGLPPAKTPDQILDETAHVLCMDPGQITKLIRSGRIVEEIVRVAREGEYDLIVLGSRGLSGWKGLLTGSVSKQVVDEAPCAVLIVK